MERINLSSYAKINLYLKVLKKRSDGYHDIETIYQAITLKDNIAIRLIKGNNDIEIYSNSRQIPTDATNLAYQAVLVLLERLNIKCGVRIDIDKNIPVSAGLGGGSSNAASCILGLNKLLRLKLNKKEMLDLALSVGSDVPFFVSSYSSAVGRGRGQILKRLRNIPKFWFILICPERKISSQEVYDSFKLNLTKKKPDVRICIRALKRGNLTEVAEAIYNDLESVVEDKVRQIHEIKSVLKDEGIKAILTSGSGPCVFGILQSREEAMQIKERIRKRQKNWAIYVCCSR